MGITGPEVPAFHSAAGSIYHTHPECAIGLLIDANERISGSGGRPWCGECTRLVRRDMGGGDARPALRIG
jgi:hypothetical protein